MKGKNWNFYVKTMQKFVMMLFGVFLIVMFCTGCTKKEEETLLLLNPEEEVEVSGVSPAEEPEITYESPMEMVEPVEQNMQAVQNVAQETEPLLLCVHICGAVQNPGVYEIPDGSRVYEAIESAGGFTQEADRDYVNRAQIVPDGAKIVIPTYEETEALLAGEDTGVSFGILQEESAKRRTKVGTGEEIKETGLVNLNTATRNELCSLPGIGEAKADAIIAYRAKIGVFTSKEQVMEIEGIKDGLYSKIKDKICIE